MLAGAIPALPVHQQWGLRLFPGIFLLHFITLLVFSILLTTSTFSSCGTCSHQWFMSAPHLGDYKPGVCSDTPCCLTVVL